MPERPAWIAGKSEAPGVAKRSGFRETCNVTVPVELGADEETFPTWMLDQPVSFLEPAPPTALSRITPS